MKKIILIIACLLLAACERPVNTILSEFHDAANAACEKNGGYEKMRVWEDRAKYSNVHIAIVCNDKAEVFISKHTTNVDGELVWGEWEIDNRRFGVW